MTRLDRGTFRAALRSGICDPPVLFTPLVDIDRRSYARLERLDRKTLREHYDAAGERMDSKTFGQMRAATERALRCAPDYLPAYRFHVGELVNDEWLAAVDWHKPFHRDHVSHQVMCAFVGNTLLNGGHNGELLFGGRSLLDWCVDVVTTSPKAEYLRNYFRNMGGASVFFDASALSRRLWKSLFREAFFLAAMYHDIGYPWQFVNNLHHQLRNNAPGGNPIAEGADCIYRQFSDRLVLYPLNGYQCRGATQPGEWTSRCIEMLRVGLAKSHGLPGALSVLHLNDCLRAYPAWESQFAASRFCVEWAAMAIMMHDFQPLYAGKKTAAYPHLRVSFARDPLSFVLTLVDQIQDFGRLNAKFSRPNGSPTIEYMSPCHRVDLEIEPSAAEMTIKYFYSSTKDYCKNIRFKRDAQQEYFDPLTGYLHYDGFPVSTINLQAVYDPDNTW